MPLKLCDSCREMITIPSANWGMVDFEGGFACSLSCVLSWANFGEGGSFPPFRSLGKRAVFQFFSGPPCFRSSLEEEFADWLEQNRVHYLYEAYTFPVGERGSYTPDFYLPEFGCFIETKGDWGVGSKKKMVQFRQDYPEIRFLVVVSELTRGLTGYALKGGV